MARRSGAEFVKILGTPTTKPTPAKEAGIEAALTTRWTWVNQPGLTVTLPGDAVDALTVHMILVEPPSTIKTQKRIGIGASRADVLKAYGKPDIKGELNNIFYGGITDATSFGFGKSKGKHAKVSYIARAPVDDAE